MEQVLDDQGGAHRGAGVAGRRVEEELLEVGLALQAAVGHAVERHAAGHAQVLRAGQLARHGREVEHRLFGHRLQGERDVLVPLVDRALGHARRPEQLDELSAVAVRAIVEVLEVGQVQLEAALGEGDELEQLAHVFAGVPVRGQAHDLALAAVGAEAEVVGQRRVERADGMREIDLGQQLDAYCPGRGRWWSTGARRSRRR